MVSTAVGPSLVTRLHVQVLEAFVELVVRRRIALDLEEQEDVVACNEDGHWIR